MNAPVVTATRFAGSTVVAAVGGILTRPCCLAPALLSLTGGSAAGLARVFATHHTAFAMMSGVLLIGSLWMNVRLQAQAWNKWLAAAATVGAFAFVARGFWF
ncbi:MAG: hypothetical protein HY047_05025 [Acidobacteria bacterium]|nr:hypothetical protein [Acidobacteriota bacterium]